MDQRPIGGNAGLDLPPQSFDAAICRLGLMFFPDRQKALAAIRRALRPGARFAGVVWSGVEKNPAFGVTLAVVEPRLDPSEAPPPIRAIVSMGDPGLLEAALSQAGFHEVAVCAAPTTVALAPELYYALAPS